MGYQDASSSGIAPRPDLDELLSRAWTQTKPIPISQVRAVLGDRFRESLLAHETMIIEKNGEGLWLAPSTWIKVLTRMKKEGKPPPDDAAQRQPGAVADAAVSAIGERTFAPDARSHRHRR
jgi:hypothetical protein